VPLIAWLGTSAPQLIGVLLAKLATPSSDRLVGHDHATDEQEFLHIAVAEAEPVVQPDAMADNFGRKAVVLIAVGGWCVHTTSMSHHAQAVQVALNKLTTPVRLSGDSMKGAGLYDGDILVVDRSLEPKHNDIVIAILDGELTVKRLYRQGTLVQLRPANPRYPIITFHADQELLIGGWSPAASASSTAKLVHTRLAQLGSPRCRSN
jgi:SOS-response transcriptional repressor LexA